MVLVVRVGAVAVFGRSVFGVGRGVLSSLVSVIGSGVGVRYRVRVGL